MCDKFNGWPNYETWAVNVHIGSDEKLYERFMSIIQNPDSVMAQADALSEWIRIDRDAQEEDIEISGAMVGLYTDLVSGALDKVDWRRIVVANREDVE